MMQHKNFGFLEMLRKCQGLAWKDALEMLLLRA
jgi:hypothetical protein